MDGDLCPSEVFQLCTEGEFSHVGDGCIYLVLQFGSKQELLALLGRERKGVGYRWQREGDRFGIDGLAWAHGPKNAGVGASFVLDVLG